MHVSYVQGQLQTPSYCRAASADRARLIAAAVAGTLLDGELFELAADTPADDLDLLEKCRNGASRGDSCEMLFAVLSAVAVQHGGEDLSDADLPSLADVRAHFAPREDAKTKQGFLAVEAVGLAFDLLKLVVKLA